jgi:hypothetical protein
VVESAVAHHCRQQKLAAQAELLGTDGILAAMHAFSQATRGERTAWQPGLALELAFMDAGSKSLSEEREIDPEPEAKPQSEPESRSEAGTASSEPEPEGTPDVRPSEGLESSSEIEDTPAEDSVPVEAETVDKGEPPRHEPEVAEDDGPQIANDSAENRYETQSGSQFQIVLDAWPELLSAAYGRDPRTQALLNSCKPLAVDDKSLVLGFKSDLLREKMEKGHNQEIVSESLGEVLDTELGVRCVLLQDWGSDQSTVPLPEGGMVAAALRDLGAEVIDYGPESRTAGTAPNWEERAEDGKEEEER